MDDTEPMATVSAPSAPATAKRAAVAVDRERRVPIGTAVASFGALCALLACAYLHGEVVTLRTELHATRVAAHNAERAADRASLDAENARSALANAMPAEPTDAPQTDDGDSER